MNDTIEPKAKASIFKRLLPVTILIIGLVTFFALGLDHYLTLDALQQNRQWLGDKVDQNLLATSIIFMLIYIVAIAFSLPGGTLLTVGGGFLFGPILGTFYVLIAATLGATTLFLAAKSALGTTLKDKAGPWLGKLENGFQENALCYLLFLRLNPAFPFFVVNLVPAFLGVKLRTYMIGTFFGIIPGTTVYAYVGAGLGSLFDSGEEISISGVLTPEIITAFVGLALLALVPVVIKRYKK